MSTITQLKQSAASVPTPAAGKVTQFVDIADAVHKQKDEADVVTPIGPSTATELGLSDGTMPLDQDPIGETGDVLTQTSDGPMQEAAFKNPRTMLVNHTVYQKRAVVVAAGLINDLTIDELLVVDLEAAAGDVTVLLPAASSAMAHRGVGFKVFGPAAGNKITLTPDGADVIDKAETTMDLTLNREYTMLRVRRGGGGWIEFEG